MYSLICRKDVEKILCALSEDINIPYETLIAKWDVHLNGLIEGFGVQLTPQKQVQQEHKCEFKIGSELCNRKVLKLSQCVNGQMLCSVHFKSMLKQAKRSSHTQCLHIYSSNSKQHGKQCPNSCKNGKLYCARHSKQVQHSNSPNSPIEISS